jgi:hypothetical protein
MCFNRTGQRKEERRMHTLRAVVWKFFCSHVCHILPSRNLKIATELTEKPLPVHRKSNIKLNTATCLCFMYTTCKNHQRLTPNWSITWSFRLSHRLRQWRALLIDLTTESGSFWTEAATDCLRSIGDGMISVEWRRTNLNSYIQI